MFKTILHVCIHALKDSIVTLPILFICYLLIELLEEKILKKYQSSKMLKSKWAPVISAGFGIIPQCGFSVVATDLYSRRVITLGSLFAIFIATSDEALPLMLDNPSNYLNLFIILAVKVVYAIIVGLTIDFIFSRKHKKQENLITNKDFGQQLDSHCENHCHDHTKKDLKSLNNNTYTVAVPANEQSNKVDTTNNQNIANKESFVNKQIGFGEEDEASEEISNSQNEEEQKIEVNSDHVAGCCKHKLEHKNNSKLKELFVHPLVHSLKIFAFIVIINFIFGLILEFVGEDVIASFMVSLGFFEPFVVSIIGLIPNCAASVLVTEAFLMGTISLGSCIAGLCVNSGIAIVTLFKMNKNLKENILILVSLYGLSCALGLVINLF